MLPRCPPANGFLSYQRPSSPDISDVLHKNEKLIYQKVDCGKRRNRQAARNLIKTRAYARVRGRRRIVRGGKDFVACEIRWEPRQTPRAPPYRENCGGGVQSRIDLYASAAIGFAIDTPWASIPQVLEHLLRRGPCRSMRGLLCLSGCALIFEQI